jgi:uncharacterized membrane protein (DUF485 family)
MAETTARHDGRAAPGMHEESIDYRRIESSAEFRELAARRRRSIAAASLVTFGGFFVYLGLATFAPGIMGTTIAGGVPLAWLAAMTQVFMTWGVTWAYLRAADREFEPLERRVIESAQPRFTREDGATGEAHVGTERRTTERSAR